MTIVIPVFNGAHVLPQTADAVLEQPVDRILYVDDGSTDETPALLGALASRDRRVTVLTHEGNRGRAQARNTGLAAVETDLTLFLDADVAPNRGYAGALRSTLRSERALAAVGTLVLAEPDADDPYHTYLGWSRRGAALSGDQPVPWRHFLAGVAAVRTSALRAAGGFPDRIAYGEDLALACRLAQDAPDGLRQSAQARAALFDIGDLVTALDKLRQFAESLPEIRSACPQALEVAGLDRLVSQRLVDRLVLGVARSTRPARIVRSWLRRVPSAMQPFAVRYLLAHTLAVHARDALTSERS